MLVLVGVAFVQRRGAISVVQRRRIRRFVKHVERVEVVVLVRLARMDEIAVNRTANVPDDCGVPHDRELRREAQQRDRRRSEAATRC